MMKKSLLFLLLVAGTGCESQKGEDYGVSPIYKILEKREIDFNKDSIKDIVLVLNDSTSADAKRPLWVLEGTKDGTYKKIISNDKVIPCAGCGARSDRPFTDFTVTDTSISFTQLLFPTDGGMRETAYSFHLDGGKWLLEKVIYQKTCDDGAGNVQPGCDDENIQLLKPQLQPPVGLQDFDIYSFDPGKYIGNQ